MFLEVGRSDDLMLKHGQVLSCPGQEFIERI